MFRRDHLSHNGRTPHTQSQSPELDFTVYIHISARPPVLDHRNQNNAFNGSFPIKERSELGPQSLKSLRSTNIAASANIRKLQPTQATQIQTDWRKDTDSSPHTFNHLSIHHYPCKIPIPYTITHPSKTTQQPQNQRSNTVMLSLPYPSAQITSANQPSLSPPTLPYTTDEAKTTAAK